MSYGTSEKKTANYTYFRATEGSLVYTVQEDGKEVKKTADYIEGRLQSISAYEDAAPGHDPVYRVRLVLLDRSDELKRYSIESSLFSMYGRMLAGQIGNVTSSATPIRIEVWQASKEAGPNHKRMTGVRILESDPFEENPKWKKVPYTRISSRDKAEGDALTLKAITGHPLYEEYVPKKGKAEPTVQFKDAVKTAGYPPFEGNEEHYLTWMRQVYKSESMTWADSNEKTWSDLATRILAKHAKGSEIPTALQAAAVSPTEDLDEDY